MIDKEVLLYLYNEKELSMNKIATELDISVGKVFNDMKFYGIKSREHLTEAQKNLSQKLIKENPLP